MFDFMFGWRKASKCKRLMKKLRGRVKLLKNKRCCVVRQLRNDVAQLIKHGHHQTAFNRVDQVYKDECIIAVYDLLAHFCEFLSRQLPYIRRSKDCPNDINEAISSLIFASARCGDLPELLRIRRLFSERYGERFEARAVDLLPGNLVNSKIRENLSINKVPNEVKYKLMEEITTTVLQTGPLALECYASEQGQLDASNGINDVHHGQHADVDFSPHQSNFSQDRSITYTDIEEFQPPLKDGETEKDQRVFMFSGVGNPKSINLLISIIIEKLADSIKVRRRSGKRTVSTDVLPPRNSEKLGVYSRAMTMPCEGWKELCVDEDGVMRSYSLPVQQCSPHVHPKLPDYDELAAKFMALKKQKFLNQEICSI
ncbi:hypothetical protein M8C21_002340 [Ambrosia artemisiifolia]|uniref:IST1-like protein n=1 Tax=Ambrosia artemisiifolia TaxID=4212 RepID=A0AAD5D8M3_AMBAR|nr:hypothetical protein M8C21_002340 [Ambrosia artemisiifolia]